MENVEFVPAIPAPRPEVKSDAVEVKSAAEPIDPVPLLPWWETVFAWVTG